MSAILLAKHLMPSTKERVTIYVLFAIVKYRSDIGGMSDGVPQMISALTKFIFVSV